MTGRTILNARFLLVCLLLPVVAGAQSLSLSPYSTYGLGDPEPSSLAPNAAMGGVQTAFISASQLNPGNPASYAAINQTTFDVGGKGTRLGVTSGGSTATTSFAYLKNISFAVPVSKKWKSSIGLLPYTRLGYNLNATETTDGFGSVDYTYNGSGSINKVYFGNSLTLKRDSLNVLAVGAHVNFLFGQLEKTRVVSPSDVLNAFNIQNINTVNITGFDADFGAFYLRKLGKSRVIVAATYGLGSNVNASLSEYTFSLSGGTTQFVEDSIEVIEDVEQKLKMPSSFGVGLTYEYGTRWTLSADYRVTNWNELNLDNTTLVAADQVAAGVQYVPNAKEITNLLKIMRYRAGFRFANTRLQASTGDQISEYGITFGVGVPLLKSASRTNFNVAMEIGQRGDDATGQIREQFTSLSVGITYTPHRFDPWFLKRRID